MSGVLSEIMIYPVKSMAGVALTSALVEQRGLQHDRRFMLVNQGRKFVNGREFPQLLQIRCQLEGDGLLIEGPSSEPLTIEFDSEPLVIQTTVWRSTVNALTVSPIADEWFSSGISTYRGGPIGMAGCKLVFIRLRDECDRPQRAVGDAWSTTAGDFDGAAGCHEGKPLWRSAARVRGEAVASLPMPADPSALLVRSPSRRPPISSPTMQVGGDG